MFHLSIAPRFITALTSTFALVLAMGLAAEVSLAQTKDQEKCINSINKGGSKVAAAQGKENSACIKNAGKEKLTQPDTDTCLTDDPKEKVAKAKGKVSATATDKCSGPANPPFGFTDDTTINDAAMNEEVALTEDIFGIPVHAAMITETESKDGAKCQASVVKSYEKYGATLVKNFSDLEFSVHERHGIPFVQLKFARVLMANVHRACGHGQCKRLFWITVRKRHNAADTQ